MVADTVAVPLASGVAVNTTSEPPAVRRFEFESFATRVAVTPKPEFTEAATLNVELANEIDPGFTVSVCVEVNAVEAIFAYPGLGRLLIFSLEQDGVF